MTTTVAIPKPVARPVLTSGSTHPDVLPLGLLLAQLGFENSVSQGTNPFNLVDESILAAVNAARSTHSIAEEADISGVPVTERRNWIGPELWEALFTDAGNPRKLAA